MAKWRGRSPPTDVAKIRILDTVSFFQMWVEFVVGSKLVSLLEGGLPIMAYMGRLRPKGVPFSGFRYKKRGDSVI